MRTEKSFKQVMDEYGKCMLIPAVYDCASAHAMEMCGFPALMLSGGEVGLAMNGAVDYGFCGLVDYEWVVSRITEAVSIPLGADIEDGFGGPLAVYRCAKRLAAAGATLLQLEDSCDMENATKLLPRDEYYAKVKAAVEALKGTDCVLMARTNADPKTELAEGCERMRVARELGAEFTTVVKIGNYEEARYVAQNVPGYKMFPDVQAPGGVPAVTMQQLTDLGFTFCSCHFTLKAAMEGMLEHGKANFAAQDVAYSFLNAPATGVMCESATPLYDPQSYMDLEGKFTGKKKVYTIVGHKVEDFPEGFVRVPAEKRL